MVSTGYLFHRPRLKASLNLYRALHPQRGRIYHFYCTWRRFILFADILADTIKVKSKGRIEFTTEGKKRRLVVGKAIKGEVEPITGADPASEVMVRNTEYWMGPDITVAVANQGRVRAFGRVWDFDGRSAEICQIDWSGPSTSN